MPLSTWTTFSNGATPPVATSMSQSECPHCGRPLDAAPAGLSGNPAGQEVPQIASAADSPLAAGSTALTHYARRRRPRSATRVALWVLACIVLVGGAFALAQHAVRRRFQRQDAPLVVNARPSTVRPEATPEGITAPRLDRLVELIEPGIVRIESVGGGQTSLGSGFVVDAKEGLVATCYHVIAEAAQAVVRFRDGSSCEIEGYAAVDTDDDLAVLKLRAVPPGLRALPLVADGDPAQLSTVIAIGHPRGLEFSPFDGRVSRVLTTTQLPEQSRRFLSHTLDEERNHRWIQHTAQLSAGNSGGPLVNLQGQVLGINTWTDRQSGFGYALHARYLKNLLERPLIQVAPLEAYAKTDARVKFLLRNLTAARIDELYAQAESLGWHPKSPEEYQILQDLAWVITAAQLPGTLDAPGLLDRQELEPVIRAADAVVERLKAKKWKGPGQVTLINEFAARRVARPADGVFVFGSVDRVVSGPDGTRGALVRVAGFSRMMFVRIDTLLVDLEPGSQCLILGVNDQGKIVRYGDNPLDLTAAHVIATRTILPLAP